MARIGKIERKTKETDIQIEVNLDGSGQHHIETGVGFLDHMLTAVAVHGLLDLTIKAVGDLHIDAHHTIEDVGIVLGQALNQALGDRSGIQRVGHAYVPMDESLVTRAAMFQAHRFIAINIINNSRPIKIRRPRVAWRSQ